MKHLSIAHLLLVSLSTIQPTISLHLADSCLPDPTFVCNKQASSQSTFSKTIGLFIHHKRWRLPAHNSTNMGRISDLCQLIWVNEWAATGNKIPEEVRALTSGATHSSSWFELLYSSKYTTANERARLRTGKLAAEGIRTHHNKHGEFPKAQVSTLKLVLRDVAWSMSARYPRKTDEAAKPNPKHKTAQIFADQIHSLPCAVDDTPEDLASRLRPGTHKSSVTKAPMSSKFELKCSRTLR